MKNKIILAVFLALAAVGAAKADEQTSAARPADSAGTTESTAVVRDTVYKNATQYALDSLKYASLVELEKVKNDRYQDSVVYSQMNSEQLYVLQMTKNNRYWRSDAENFLYQGPFVALVVGLCIMLAFWMVLKARDRGKQRSHELKMAQFEAMQKAKIVYRERAARSGGRVEEEVYEMPMSYPAEGAAQMYERAKGDVKSYLSSPRKYRKTGVILLIIAFGTMLFFASISHNGPWQLGFIPLFIGLAYLYLDYAAQKSDAQRREMEEFLRYKAEKEDSKTPEELRAQQQGKPETGDKQ